MEFGIGQVVLFNLFILALLAVDLGLFSRKSQAIGIRHALAMSCVWVVIALSFGGYLFHSYGRHIGSEFLAGYLIEWSLSVDNIFVFVLVFSYFRIPHKYQHRVLFWGILSALVLRGIMIVAGAALIQRFHWILYVFGIFLIFTGARMAFHSSESLDPGETWVVRLARRFLPITDSLHEHHFLIRQGGRWVITPLLIVLMVIETTDIVFALDSIPAIFAVTTKPFIVYTSNVFAILGLRSMYFVLARFMELFRYLKYGLAGVLTFVGVKMLLGDSRWHISTPTALEVIACLLGASIIASLIVAHYEKLGQKPPFDDENGSGSEPKES